MEALDTDVLESKLKTSELKSSYHKLVMAKIKKNHGPLTGTVTFEGRSCLQVIYDECISAICLETHTPINPEAPTVDPYSWLSSYGEGRGLAEPMPVGWSPTASQQTRQTTTLEVLRDLWARWAV